MLNLGTPTASDNQLTSFPCNPILVLKDGGRLSHMGEQEWSLTPFSMSFSVCLATAIVLSPPASFGGLLTVLTVSVHCHFLPGNRRCRL